MLQFWCRSILFMKIYRKYRNFGILGVFLFFVFGLSFKNDTFIMVCSVLIAVWFVGLIPMALIGKRREYKAKENLDKLVELELKEKLEQQKATEIENMNN